MIRTFIAVELSSALRGRIGDLQQRVKGELARELRRRAPDARIQWVRTESMHLTVKFLGDVTEDSIKDIEHALARIAQGHAAFSVEVAGLGVFPGARAPRVLWLGLAGEVDRLAALAQALDEALADLGYPRERRPFQPHLTLARIKDRGREVGQALGGTGWLDQRTMLGSLEVTALSLIKSDLTPGGAIYTRLAEFELGQT